MRHTKTFLSLLISLLIIIIGLSASAADPSEIIPTITNTETTFYTETPTSTLTEIPPTASETGSPIPTAEMSTEPAPSPTISSTPEATFTLLPSPTMTPSPTLQMLDFPGELVSPFKVMIHDNFDQGPLAIWELGAGWVSVLSETGQALQGINPTGQLRLNYENIAALMLETRFKLDIGAVSIVLREDQTEQYRVTLDKLGTITLMKNDVLISSIIAPSISDTNWHTVRVSIIGTMIHIWLDGMEIISFEDNFPISSGRISFISDNAETVITLDDVRLWLIEFPQLLGEANIALEELSVEASEVTSGKRFTK